MKKVGRPKLSETESSSTINARVLTSHAEEFKRRGGAKWLREALSVRDKSAEERVRQLAAKLADNETQSTKENHELNK